MVKTSKFFLLFCLLTSISCDNSHDESIKEKTKKPPVKRLDSISKVKENTAQSTFSLKQDSAKKIIPQKLNQAKNSKKTKAFLNNPFDFIKFKKEVRGANTTKSLKYDSHYRPKHKGFFFTYFVFNGCHPRGLQITVYKEGKEMGKFSDKNETVICVENKCSLEALNGLNLIGKDLDYIEDKIGSNYIKSGNKILFAEKGIFLVLEIYSNSSVKKYKYLKTNQEKIESFNDIQLL